MQCFKSHYHKRESTFFFQVFYFFIFFFKFYFILFLNLKNCISFAKHQNKSTTGIHTLPILNPPPSFLPTPSLWVVPVHQPQASSIVHRTWTGIETCVISCMKRVGNLFKCGKPYLKTLVKNLTQGRTGEEGKSDS